MITTMHSMSNYNMYYAELQCVLCLTTGKLAFVLHKIAIVLYYRWTKSDISSFRKQGGYVHGISCPLHISSQHDISHFLQHVMWTIEPNPLHIMDAGQKIFPLSVLNMTQEISCYMICVYSTGAWHVGILPTPPWPLPLYFAFTCIHILYKIIKWYNKHK